MRVLLHKTQKRFFTASILLTLSTASAAYDISDSLSVGGVLAAASQCQRLDGSAVADSCGWAVPFQPELSYRPGKNDELFFKLGFAQGNGLEFHSPFSVSPWSADLSDGVKNINGSDRDHLLMAWYGHGFQFTDETSLYMTFGIIDASQYLDLNRYANDEYKQFMNAALTNGPNVFLPSYDPGMVLELDAGAWTFKGVLMQIRKNIDGNRTTFYGFQIGYQVNNKLGAGNYRLIYTGSSKDFLDASGTMLVKSNTTLLSFDQELGAMLGGWIRLGWRNDDSANDHDAIYSGGIDISGEAWGRGSDNIGIGSAYLTDGNLLIERTRLAEFYYRWQYEKIYALTADIQHMRDDYDTGLKVGGWIVGVRATVAF